VQLTTSLGNPPVSLLQQCMNILTGQVSALCRFFREGWRASARLFPLRFAAGRERLPGERKKKRIRVPRMHEGR